jgi:hypothetical protein
VGVVLGIVLALASVGCSSSGSITSLFDSLNPTTTTPPAVVPDPVNIRVEDVIAKSARILWDLPSASVTSYTLSLSAAATPVEKCAGDVISSSSTLTFSFTSLLPDTTYYYRICSVADGVSSSGVTGLFKTLKFAPRNPSYSAFANWNDYLLNDGTKPYNANSNACPSAYYAISNACINGGLNQKMILPEVIDCSRIKVTDSLGVFRWQCEKTGTETIIFSANVGSFKGLSDLIANGQFKNNYVVVKIDGTDKYSSDSEKWWTNVIEPLPVAAAGATVSLTNSGETSGKIFYLDTTQVGGDYNISEDNISIVVMNNAQLKESASNTTGLITATSRRFIWLEGSFIGNKISDHVITFSNLTFSSFHRLQKIEVAGDSPSPSFNYGAIFLNSAISVTISDFVIRDSQIGIYGSSGGSIGHIFSNGRFSDISNIAIYYTAKSVFQNIQFTGFSAASDVIGYPSNSVYQNMTFANNAGTYDLRFVWGGNSLVHNLLSINSAGYSNYTWRSSNLTYSQMMTGKNTFGSQNVQRPEAAPHQFKNNLVMESASCSTSAGGSPYDMGITSACANSGASTATFLTPTFDFSKIFVGKVTTNDTVNSTDLFGAAVFSSLLDWLHFESPFRIWGLDGSTFPHSTNWGACTSGNCRIWDYRLKADNANIAFNNTDLVTSKNPAFIAGATCPSVLNGNKVTTYTNSTPTTFTFLTHAQEVLLDGIGNDNGLCESNESCIYTPNFGAYQGEGDYYSNGTCLFQDGTVSGVNVYAYPVNGVL